MGRIAPGEKWVHPAKPFLLWHFRTGTSETVEMWVHPYSASSDQPAPKPPYQVVLTSAYMEACRAHKASSKATGPRATEPLQLLGERRA